MTDQQLHDEILAELDYEPELHAERIGVSVERGVVTLSGHADSYRQKLAAERAVKRVYSAKAVVDELEVRLPSRDEVPDLELAQAAIRTLEAQNAAPPDSVRITVRDGHLLLEGEVEWHYQRQATEAALRHLRGVRGVKNHLQVREAASSEGVQECVEAALRRLAEVEADGITVETVGSMAILRGEVHSLREREDVEQAAWRAPGVSEVENRLRVAL